MVKSNSEITALQQAIAERGKLFSEELARTNARFEERIRELSVIRRIVDALKDIQDARKVFEGILDTIIDETNAENCSLMLLDPETDVLVVKAARSQTDSESRYYGEGGAVGRSFRKGEGIAGWVAENGESVSISDIAKDKRFVGATQAIGPIGSILCLPLSLDGAVVGVVNLSHPLVGAFTEADVRLMALVADQVAVALHSVQLFDHTLQLNDVLEKEVRKATENLQRTNAVLEQEIVERKQAEQELVRTQRLRAVGELSAGVSHNLNNILTGIWGPAQLLQRITRDPHLVRQADLIVKFAERAADLVARLHQATRMEEETDLAAVGVNDIVKEVVETGQPRWKDEPESRGISIQVETDLKYVPPILGTASGLYDMLLNLLLNAVDALPEGGTVFMGTQVVDSSVQITVRDTGIGMDEATLKRIFEPFFTTKVDVGCGLGLATVYGTVHRWDGQLEVESHPGEGTTFTLTFPVFAEAESEPEPVETGSVRRGRILVVDDEEDICEIVSMILRDDHDVDVAHHATEALRLFEAGTYDVALIDLGMPETPGDQLASELRQIDPTTVLVLTTGWRLEEKDTRLGGFDFWIQKPFRGLDRLKSVVAQGILLRDERSGLPGDNS